MHSMTLKIYVSHIKLCILWFGSLQPLWKGYSSTYDFSHKNDIPSLVRNMYFIYFIKFKVEYL